MEPITVFVFDHSSGFDWYYYEQDAIDARDDYCIEGWLGEGDSLWAVPIPGMAGDRSVDDQTIGNNYLDSEDYAEMPGAVCLWINNGHN